MFKDPAQQFSSAADRFMRQAAAAALIGLLYFLCASASRLLVVEPQGITPLWPPSGLLLAALVLRRQQTWSATLLAAFVANLLANLLTGAAPLLSVGFAFVNCAESVFAAILLRRRVGMPLTLTRLRALVGFVGWVVIASTAASAVLGATLAWLALGAPFWSTWLTWWIADALGILLVGSTILTWAASIKAHQRLTIREGVEFVLLCTSAAVAALLTFAGPPTALSYPYQMLPFLLWAALRFGPRQTATLALFLAVIVLWSTIRGLGPFAAFGQPIGWRVLAAQTFLIVVTISALVPAAVTAERRQARAALQRAKDDLQRAYLDLEQRIAGRTAALAEANWQLQHESAERQRAESFLSSVLQQLPSGVSIAEAPSGRLLMHNEEAERLLGHPLRESASYEGYSLYGALHADGRPYEPDEYPLARALLRHEVVRQEPMIYQRGDGTRTIFSVNAAPIRNLEGEVAAVVSTFHDIGSLKQMEATLANSQAQLASIIDSAMDAIITVDEEQQITIWNAAAERLFGCPAADALGQSLDRFIPARLRERHHDHMRAFSHTGTTTRAMGGLQPLSALRTNGEEFPIEASISQVMIDGHKLYTVILRDITERQRAEGDLRRSEERFSKAFRSSPIAMVISAVDDGRILDVNERFLRLFGRTRIDVLGHSSLMLGMWADPDDRTRAIALLRQHDHVRDLEVVVRAVGDELRNVLLSADLLTLAGEPCILTTLYDISERKQAEEELHKSRQQLQAILDHAPALISLKHPDGYYELVNRRFGRLLGREPAQIIGYTDAELFPAELALAFQLSDQAVLKSGIPVEVEERVPHDDGFHIYQLVKFPLTDLSGESYALGSIATDITERKRLEAQLFQAQKMESIGQLAGGIAHDFNNLLTAISGYTDLALNSLPPDSDVLDDLHEVLKAADRATGLTRQLLAFARRQPIDPYVINLNNLIADLDKLLRRLVNESIAFNVRLAIDLHRVKVDPGQIEQVLLNLVVNARDAMPEGGQLTIETANVTLDPRYAYGHLDIPAGRYIMFAVSDTGLGMSPEVQTRVFEPFFTTKEPGKGTGLGLSTCYGIVKQHGGTIWIYSEPGDGTVVKVYLPVVEDPLTPAYESDQNTPLPQGTETILVVEDEAAVRTLAVRVLRTCGYNVIEAVNGLEAVGIAQAHLPATIHLLLSDVVMPYLGGQATAEQIALLYPSIRVLLMSGYTEHATVQHSRIDVGQPFLQKPFTPATLAQSVRAVLDHGRLRLA